METTRVHSGHCTIRIWEGRGHLFNTEWFHLQQQYCLSRQRIPCCTFEEGQCFGPSHLNCLTAIGHKSGSPVQRDGPLVACICLEFSTNNIYCYWLMRAVCSVPIKKGLSNLHDTRCFSHCRQRESRFYNFLKNVNITDIISSLHGQ